MLRIRAYGSTPAGQWCASFKQLVLHTTAVLFKAFVVTTVFIGSMQQVKSFENVVRQGMTTLRFTQWLTRPALPSL